MSTCPNKEMYSLYIDKELSHSKCLSFEKHLEGCEECQNQLNNTKALQSALQSLNVEYDSEEGYRKLKERMHYRDVTTPQRPFSSATFFIRFASVAAAVLLISVVIPVVRFMNRGTPDVNAMLAFYTMNPLINDSEIEDCMLMTQRGVILDEEIALVKLTSGSTYGHAVTMKVFEYPKIDYFKPQIFDVHPLIAIKCIDVPTTTIVEEKDIFGFSKPVFLLRE